MFKAIITDIEGTTTSISFVKDILFPYSIENVEGYLKKVWNEETFINLKDELIKSSASKEYEKINLIKEPKTIDDVVFNVKKWIGNDIKVTPVKELQGLIWEEGYKNGSLKGHVYDDVVPALERFKDKGINLYVYSSGSVKAQKLLYQHTNKGDLTKYFDNYFDTNIGHKIDSTSYKKIADKIGVKPLEGLFLTDVAKEAIAAEGAGMKTILVVRPGNEPLIPGSCDHIQQIKSFDEIVC
uniref:Enolase-phosphatase E1 n=1 Tax=Parastrongyloides trichosuri TaxID=131310 RepID=A0A0N4Z8W6_PARTI